MYREMKLKIHQWLLRSLYIGVDQSDFIDYTQLTESGQREYETEAQRLLKSDVLNAEIERLILRLNKKLVERAASVDDIIYARAQADLLRELRARLHELTSRLKEREQ